MAKNTNDNEQRTVIMFSLLNAFSVVAKPTMEEFESRLETKYKCDLYDCLDRPEFLKKAIKEFYKEKSKKIFGSFCKSLEKAEETESIKNFKKILCE